MQGDSMRNLVLPVVVALLGICPSAASASTITFTGKDAGVSYGGPFTNSDIAHAAFDALIVGNGQTLNLIDFEGAPVGAFTSLNLGNGVSASFTNQGAASGISNQNPSGFGTFDTTRPGTEYILFQTLAVSQPATTTATLTFTFANPINSFGAYISGLGNDAPFNYQFNDATGQVTITASGLSNGFNEVQFLGFTDFGQAISSVALNLTDVPPNANINWLYSVGIDDVNYSAAVPEPASLLLLGTGVAALVARRRKTSSPI
jgi:hypothetical protein